MSRGSVREYRTRWVFSALAVIVLVPILALVVSMVWAHHANNAGARKFEERLLALEMPPQTKLVDSAWGVARFHGQGNGAQQGGGLLLLSNLTIEELDVFYKNQPGHPSVMPANEDHVGRESVLFRQDHDLRQPGLFIVFDAVELTSSLLRDLDIRGN